MNHRDRETFKRPKSQKDYRRLVRLLVWAHVGYQNHSGQWSTGYRLGCRASSLLARDYGIRYPLDIRLKGGRAVMAQRLAIKYRDQL